MNVPRFHVEPIGARLDDLVFSKTGIKPAIKNELEFVRWSSVDDFVPLLEIAKFRAGGFDDFL